MGRVVFAVWLVVGAGCAQGGGSGDGGSGGDVGFDGALDTGPPDTRRDTGRADTMIGDMCDGITCMAFEECIMGTCQPLPACVSDTECSEGRICLHRFCIPATRDVDGDGWIAAEDCDETNPNINPGEDEVCNLIDDNCSGTADDGDPGLMCVPSGGGICIDGSCGCPDGLFDLDREPSNGCECTAMPAIGLGESCEAPIDLGDLSDAGAGQMMSVPGNLLPGGREVWYRFRAVDTVDTSCDNLHVRVQLTTNPGDVYRFQVFRGACTTATCDAGMTYQDFRWATDFRQTIGGVLTGECPCTSSFARTFNVSVCTDQTAEYFVKVTRQDGAMLSCEPYTLEVSNGVFDT
jgi:hypothetical protein